MFDKTVNLVLFNVVVIACLWAFVEAVDRGLL